MHKYYFQWQTFGTTEIEAASRIEAVGKFNAIGDKAFAAALLAYDEIEIPIVVRDGGKEFSDHQLSDENDDAV